MTRKTILDQSEDCENKNFKRFSQTLVGKERGIGGTVGRVGGWGGRLSRGGEGWGREDG
jgi:hypothetical protein